MAVHKDKDIQKTVLEILDNFQGIEPLKNLFWTVLNYDRVNEPLSRRNWPNSVKNAVADNPLLFASGGADSDFHIVYCRLNSETLSRGLERPVVNQILKEYPYNLMIFSDHGQTHWHFLNVKYDEDIQKRQLIRRMTLGPGERLRTAAQRIALLDLEDISTELHRISPMSIQERCDKAFDVESVTKEFFETFAKLYHTVEDDITEVRGLEKEAGKLAQLILDRMIFLYFIQKKGWLNQESDYLYERFLKCWKADPKGTTYYTSVLCPLFLCLSDATCKFDYVGSVPFLNGGLFEESAGKSQGERLLQARLKIKNKTFKEIFDQLLEKFNFTVTEDTPLDVEVAIDPEMLGKIFESLILQLEKDPDKDLRKMTGSYYTPRSIVHFMCQEALTEYLSKQLAGNSEEKAIITREKLSQLLVMPPADQLDDEQIKLLPTLFTEAEAKILTQAIKECRVCDPAVGSGAFPVGMLHEMVAAIARLDIRIDGKDRITQRNYDYDLKKQIIESSLYGVDIQEQAVRLCELRLWLSLVVDYIIDPKKPFAVAVREIPSLPNLSYRIMRGDSLLERLFGHVIQLDKMTEDAKTKQIIESIQADKQSYFHEGKTEYKRHLELKILAKQADLAERLIEAKKKAKTVYQTNIFGVSEMTAKERQKKTEHEEQVKELEDLGLKVAKAKMQLELLVRQKGYVGRGDIEELRRKYFHTGDSPTFIWRVDFAEVFAGKKGFDIVIENPPYLSARRFQDLKKALSKCYTTPYGSYDIYVIFFELGKKILNEGGVQCLITSNKFLLADYALRLREFLKAHFKIKKFIDLADCTRVFQALVSPAISLMTLGRTEQEDTIEVAILEGYQYLDINEDYFSQKKLRELQREPEKPFDIYVCSGSKESGQMMG